MTEDIDKGVFHNGELPPVASDNSEPTEHVDSVPYVDRSVAEYEALRDELGLVDPIIAYPACGSDTALVRVFPNSETYYIDTDEEEIQKLRDAHLPPASHVIHASAHEYNPPTPVDLVVLRNAATYGSTVDLTRWLKPGGYVLESAWGSVWGAKELLREPGLQYVGVMTPTEGQPNKVFLQRELKEAVEARLATADSIGGSEHAGKGYIFQKTAQ